MTIAVQNENVLANSVRSVCAQHRRLLKRLEPISHYLGGIVAGLWLPGIDSTFDNPVRSVKGRRPVFLTIEACDNGTLNFTGAISRLRDDKLVFSPIFAYDVSMPYAPRGGGRVLPANNLVLARRANELLSALISYARDVAFGVQPELAPPSFPDIVCDADGNIFEDYTPVLGFSIPNPAKTLSAIPVQRHNPAAKILARHGVENVKTCSAQQIENVLTEFRAEFPEFQIDVQDVFKAIADPNDAFFTFTVPFNEALLADQQATVNAIRDELPHKYKLDAGYNDLLTAAKNPDEPVKISRFSALQIFPVETVQDLPESYAGTVLAPVNWAPASSTFGQATT